MKPCKRGIKIWSRCDSTNGYLGQFEVYVGENYFVSMDNLFASVYLFQELLSVNIYCCGTVRANRKGFPAMLKGVNFKEQGD